MKKRFATLWVLSILLTCPETHAAQVLFLPELSISEEYTDNIFLTPDNEEDDFITSTGISLTGQILGRTAGLELNYNPSYNLFAENSELDYWRHAGRVRAWNDFKRNTRLLFTNDYLETEDPRDAVLIEEEPLGEPLIGVDLNRQGRTRYRRNSAEGRLSHQFGSKNSVYSAVRYTILEDIDTFEEIPVDDYTFLEPSLGIEYWFAPEWGLQFDGFYSNRDYEERNDREEYTGTARILKQVTRTLSAFLEYRHTYLDYADNSTDSDFNVYMPALGIRYQFQENAHMLLSGGYYIQEFENKDLVEDETEEGFLINSEIFKRWAIRKAYVDLTGRSGYGIQDRGVDDLGFNIYYEGRIGVGYNFSSRLSATVFGAYRIDEYPDRDPERTDERINAGTSLSYQLLRWMNVGVSYNYRDLGSDIESEEYTENSVMLRIDLSPSRPFSIN